ncbi:ABC transporter permease [Cohnella hongkongensis]|uniref:Transport permease protein n=1 Tax=Cohnella hongkongensis TaxID=178337 RepID=A0ABV9FES7_9BACL
MLRSIWHHKNLIFNMALKDLRDKYVGTAMGFIWNIVSPLTQIIIYSLVFSQLMRVKMGEDLGDYAFSIYLCSGLLPWIAFNEIVIRGTQTLNENATYLKKLPIPEIVFFTKNALSSFFSAVLSLCILFIVNLVLGGEVNVSWLVLPFYIVLMLTFGYALSILFGILNVFLRDTVQIVTILLQVWMWLTPIVYLIDILPGNMQKLVYWNPMYYYIEPIHQVVMNGQYGTLNNFATMMAFSLLTLILSYALLKRIKSEVRDVL